MIKTVEPIDTWPPERMSNLLDFADAAGSLATTKKGAISAMLNESQIRDYIQNIPRCSLRQ